jgi:hypothetical protein
MTFDRVEFGCDLMQKCIYLVEVVGNECIDCAAAGGAKRLEIFMRWLAEVSEWRSLL